VNKQAFTTLEYQHLLELIKRNAQTEAGQRRVETLSPIDDASDLRRALARSRMRQLRTRGVKWYFNGLTIRRRRSRVCVSKARVSIHSRSCKLRVFAIRRCRRVLRFSPSVKNAPVLWQLVQDLPRELNTLVARVTNKILPSGELDDRASPELASIRHEINVCRRVSRARSKD
jgi:dsDNA-specific endonuclease/ATPase MutS2